ncbi:MAG TPA: 16S rRNA (guanine(527)-N(7))-methyltransferase RsmG [Smithellaceae bacterium]|nr:16S rRNA (guanine(527)-N(7))-methyltransferase RsmG [Smithellaceae bacterium]HRS82272.1 16S rRNA (guanine(527)-N(7))-methyltransferase RsmG [Smithellaceae bacterium]HRV45150.1 16S rRNA (guanine(527)-N(7))-methyltransferase RsmG [Smithellaceae bacterium]
MLFPYNMNPDMIFLQQGAKLLGLELTDRQIDQFDLYRQELLKWNARTNLISKSTERQIAARHFLDSLTAARFIRPDNARLVDIGSGAGFPGLPLKIALPSIQLCLLESNRKKVSFLKYIERLLNLDGVVTLQDRTENIVRKDQWREKFDVVISRASLKLPDLVLLGQYFLVTGGLLITLKGPAASLELEAALSGENSTKLYQLYQEDINLPFLGPPRKIIVLQKAK